MYPKMSKSNLIYVLSGAKIRLFCEKPQKNAEKILDSEIYSKKSRRPCVAVGISLSAFVWFLHSHSIVAGGFEETS